MNHQRFHRPLTVADHLKQYLDDWDGDYDIDCEITAWTNSPLPFETGSKIAINRQSRWPYGWQPKPRLPF